MKFCVGQRTPGCVGISNVVLSEKRCDLRVSRPDAVASPGMQVFLAEFTKTALTPAVILGRATWVASWNCRWALCSRPSFV